MMRRHLQTLVYSLFFLTASYGQQQQMYTQFMFNKLNINPGFAGNETYLTGTAIYRDQWHGFPGSPKAQTLTVNLPRIGKRVGIGFNVERQSIGITQKITYQGMYAYKFNLGEGTLSMGLSAAGRNYRVDFTDPSLYAVQGVVNDPALGDVIQTKNLFNAGFGVYYNTTQFYIGAAIPRMIKADIDFDNNNLFSTEVRHLWMMTGATFRVSKDWRYTPQLLFKAAENTPFGIDVNNSFTMKEKYTMGLTYRTGGSSGDFGESIDLITGVQLSENVMLGLAYDITLAKIRTASSGSIEVMLNYNLIPRKIKTVVINPRYF
jgi:type IX secretion system PorP/SprF family membrane protein